MKEYKGIECPTCGKFLDMSELRGCREIICLYCNGKIKMIIGCKADMAWTRPIITLAQKERRS